MPRYERLFALVGIVLMGLGLILLVERIHTLTVSFPLPGELQARISIAWLVLFFLLIVVAVGTSSLRHESQDHPSGGRFIRLHPVAWITPMLLTLTTFLFLRLLHSILARSLGLVIAGLLLFLALIAQQYSYDERPRVRRLSYFFLDVLMYAISFFLYGAIYGLKVRSLFSATPIVLLTFLLGFGFLYRIAPLGQAGLYAAVVGLCVGEITWPLNYLPISGLIGGAFLLVVFYAMLNLARHQLQGTLIWQIALEYIGVALLAIALIGLYVFLLSRLLGVRL